jgi:retron-type reverse transcriptase
MAFTNLAHHIDIVWLRKAHALTRKDGAVGVDGQTAEDYETNLEGNLQDLLNRAKSGTYVAPPVRRVHIPKAGSLGETRPLGIPMFRSYCTSLQRGWGLTGGTAAHPWALPWS